MTVDVDRMVEAELLDLNRRIVARLRLLHQAHTDMPEFKTGNRVAFLPPGRERVEGVLTRRNEEIAAVIGDDGRRWNVSARRLSKVVPSTTTGIKGANVFLLGKSLPHRSLHASTLCGL